MAKFKAKSSAGSGHAGALARLEQRFKIDHPDDDFDPSSEIEITPLFKHIDGGVARIIEALRVHDDDDAKDFLEAYDTTTVTDRKYLRLEEIACAAEISSLRLAEIIQTALFLHGKLTTSFLLSSSMHKVVATSLKQAVKPSGLADREWMLKASGVLPTPKGTQIAIQNVAGEKAENKVVDAEPVYLDPGERLRMIHDAVEARRLPSPPSEPMNTLDHMQTSVAEILVDRGA